MSDDISYWIGFAAGWMAGALGMWTMMRKPDTTAHGEKAKE